MLLVQGKNGGKAFKRGVEYHITNLVACYFLQFDILIDLDSAESLKQLCIHLRNSLHNRGINVNEILDELKKLVISDISPLLDDSTREGLARFLSNYLNQVECLLHIIRACRQIDFNEYLAALDQQCKYFFVFLLL